MNCLVILAHKWLPFLYEKEVAKQEELKNKIDFLKSVIDAKERMNEHLVQGIKQRKLEYDFLASRYQKAIQKLSQYIENDDRPKETEEKNDSKTA